MPENELLTPDELAAEVKIPAKTLPQWRYQGRGPRFIKVGRHIRYRRSDVDRWLEEQASEPAA